VHTVPSSQRQLQSVPPPFGVQVSFGPQTYPDRQQTFGHSMGAPGTQHRPSERHVAPSGQQVPKQGTGNSVEQQNDGSTVLQIPPGGQQ
jgi:hypothetical protein